MRPAKFGLGQPVLRLEDERFITGRGEYTSDCEPGNVAHAIVLRSPHAKARFTIGDISAAASLPGVRLILTAADLTHLNGLPSATKLPNGDGTPGNYPSIPLLCDGEVRHVGDAVAFIVADSLVMARDAAEAIDIDWMPEPAVSDLRAALDPAARQVHEDAPGNVAFDTAMGDKAKVDKIFAGAARIVSLDVLNNRLVTNYMETRAAIAEYDASTQSFTLTVTSQGVHGIRTLLMAALGVEEAKLRVITPDVGGGFGTKSFVYREYALVAEAARRLGRPVSWVADRTDHFQSDAHGRDNITVAEVALSRGGKFLAMRFDWIGGLGAYPHQYGPYIHLLGATMLTGPYATPAIHVRVRGVYTNTVPTDAYRGAGRPEASYTLERLVDHVAREIGMRPDRLRRPQLHQARRDALQDADRRPDLRCRRVRGAYAACAGGGRCVGFRGSGPRVAQGRQVEGPRPCLLHRMHRLGFGARPSPCASTAMAASPSIPAPSRTARATRRRMPSLRARFWTCRHR